MSELDMLCLAMEHLFQDGMLPPKFKGSNKCLVSDRVEDEELSQKMSQDSPDEVPEPGENVLWELHCEDTPNDMGDHSLHLSYERFSFGLYEPKIYQNKVSGDESPGSSPIESSTLDWDSDGELLQELPSNRARNIHASAPDAVFLDFKEDLCQQNGDIQKLGKAYCKLGHLLQSPSLCEALMTDDDIDNLNPIQSWPVSDGDKTSAQEPLFAMDQTRNGAGSPNSNEWATENLFAQDESLEPEEHHRDIIKYSGCGTFDAAKDIDLLSEASTESTTTILNHES
ncbi:hypothetical protein AX14_000982 [Amanita brunnescens Koide BX004]|nr:hypothetical protein AX14_000982 [Amanita brunnescens Koide BX004]